MRSDEKASDIGRSNDISADELLLLLNQSIAEKDNAKPKRRSYTIDSSGESLEIDDDVYDIAKKELRRSEAVRTTDDSDLDIDELIEKFINEPKREREKNAVKKENVLIDNNGDEIVKEYSEADVDASHNAIGALSDNQAALTEIDADEALLAEPETEDDNSEVEKTVENALEEATVDTVDADEAESSCESGEEMESDDNSKASVHYEGNEQLKLFNDLLKNEVDAGDDSLPESDSAETANVLSDEYDDDSDVKIVGSLEELTSDTDADTAIADDFDGEPGIDKIQTAVFDIALVRELAESGELADDEELAGARTEIFTSVSDDDIINEVAELDEIAIPSEGVTSEAYSDNGDESFEVPEERVVLTPDSDDTIDRTDLNLMVALGMSDELVDTVGEEQATAIEDDIIQRHEESEQMQAEAARREFTSFDQVRDILVGYQKKYYILIARMALAVILLIGLMLFENHSMFGIDLPSYLRPSSYPVVYAMIDLQMVVLCGALVGRQIIDGIKDIIRLKPTPECLTAFMMILSVVYTLIICLFAPVGGFKLFNMPVAFAVLLALLYEFLHLRRDIFSFNVVASARKKYVINPVSAETEALERAAFDEFVPAESEIVRVVKTDFVDGFFKRVAESKVVKPSIGIAIPAVIALAVAFILLAFVKTGSAYESVSMAFMTAAFTMPLATFVIYSYPFYVASKDSYSNDSAIIGESSLTEYSTSAVISFEDKEVFPSAGVKVTSIKVYGNNRIDEIIYKLSSAFIKVGGPLADVFRQATHELGHSENVELISVDDDGFTVSVDDVQTYIGKSTYMEKNDYDPPYDHEGRRQEQEGEVGVMYIAYGGQLAAKVYVRYSIDGEFEKILSHLNRTGLCVGIKSFDPNIDDLLLSRKIRTSKYPVKVIRSKTVEDIPHSYERSDSGIVSTRSVKSLLRTVARCERVGSVIKTSLMVKILSMLIGVVIMALIYAFGDVAGVYSLYITLYQLFWAVPVLLISKFLV